MNNESKSDTYNTIHHWGNFKYMLVIQCVLVGLLSSLTIVFYRFILEKLGVITHAVYSYLRVNPQFIPLWFLVLIILALIVAYLVKKEPLISGSGIPQVKAMILDQVEGSWIKVLTFKFIGGVLSLAAGLSLGREGPSIQLGGSIGQGVNKIFKRGKVEEKYLITSGASAGLAAAFNAPLAGVMFSLEELHKSFSPLILISTITSAVTADIVSKNFFGMNPIFNFKDTKVLPLNGYFHLIFLGIILGLLGVVFNSGIMKSFKFYKKLKLIPTPLRMAIPFIMAGIFGLVLPEVLGGGHELIVSIVTSPPTLKMLLLLLVMKLFFTIMSFGSGTPGGIFLPLLSIGAIIGCIYGTVVTSVFNLDSCYIFNFVILAMAGYFAAIVRAPITGIILITEMSGSFNHLLSLTIVSIVAYFTADYLKSKPIYDSLLHKLLKNRKNTFVKEDKHKIIIEIPVSLNCDFDGKQIKDIEWPEDILIVGIRRGEEELIPNGTTELFPGDFLIILTDDERASFIKENLLDKSGLL